jgi:hypothetical protein
MAEAAEVVSAHFRPRFDALWSGGRGVGKLTDMDGYALLRTYTLDKDAEAKSWRKDEALLLAAADALDAAMQGNRKDGSSPNENPPPSSRDGKP